MTPEQWEEAADYLDECSYCGKIHPRRTLPGSMVTWADLVDGHAYRRRGSNGGTLRDKAMQLRASVPS